ncbi:hypothetical protein B0H16DRAFT_1531372 [Mycena metata]|uniref:Uncharacterized protein n=1 Tax=Mycena metata TaxID=1033252 RepID=A0AAD7JEU5_9AGAR|nr:hypothetical protein B0H16DRAFT_1531372 [Mycena metata]
MRRSLTLLATTLLLLTVSAAAALTSNTTDSPSAKQLDCAKFDCFDNAVAATGCNACVFDLYKQRQQHLHLRLLPLHH